MKNQIRDRLSKVYALVQNGATEGEKAAARKALDRLIDKHKINIEDLSDLGIKQYVFTYTSQLEIYLLQALRRMNEAIHQRQSFQDPTVKRIAMKLTYEEWITIESSYEYFRRHMKAQWLKVSKPELAKCRKAKTKNKRRAELQELFIRRYLIESMLYRPGDIEKVAVEEGSKEWHDRMKMKDVEGGRYNKQMAGGLYLT